MSGLNPDGLGVNRTFGNVESDSVNTVSSRIEGGDRTNAAVANYRVPDGEPNAGQVVREGYDDIQAAIDAIPKADNNDSWRGWVQIMSRGGGSTDTNPDGSESFWEVTEPIQIPADGKQQKGGLVQGHGIHTKVRGNLDDQPVVEMGDADHVLQHLWVDNVGVGGAAIEMNLNVDSSENYLYDLNVDYAGDYGIRWDGNAQIQWLRSIEVKDGAAAAISAGGRGFLSDINIEQYDPSNEIGTGLRLRNGNNRVHGAEIRLDRDAGSDWGVTSGGSDNLLTGINVGATTRYDGASGPTIGYEIRNKTYAFGITEQDCSTGIRFHNNPTQSIIYGNFPDGVDESSAGDANLNIINGLGWDNAGAGNSPAVSDWDWTSGVKVWNRDDDTIWQLLGDASTWVQLA